MGSEEISIALTIVYFAGVITGIIIMMAMIKIIQRLERSSDNHTKTK